MQPKWLELCFSNFKVHISHLDICKKCWLDLVSSGVEPDILRIKQVRRLVQGPPTLRVAKHWSINRQGSSPSGPSCLAAAAFTTLSPCLHLISPLGSSVHLTFPLRGISVLWMCCALALLFASAYALPSAWTTLHIPLLLTSPSAFNHTSPPLQSRSWLQSILWVLLFGRDLTYLNSECSLKSGKWIYLG